MRLKKDGLITRGRPDPDHARAGIPMALDVFFTNSYMFGVRLCAGYKLLNFDDSYYHVHRRRREYPTYVSTAFEDIFEDKGFGLDNKRVRRNRDIMRKYRVKSSLLWRMNCGVILMLKKG